MRTYKKWYGTQKNQKRDFFKQESESFKTKMATDFPNYKKACCPIGQQFLSNIEKKTKGALITCQRELPITVVLALKKWFS